MTHSNMIQAQIDPILKEEAEDIFEKLGLSTNEAITLFYQQVKMKGELPFDVHVPNEDTLRTFQETDAGENIVQCNDEKDLFHQLGI